MLYLSGYDIADSFNDRSGLFYDDIENEILGWEAANNARLDRHYSVHAEFEVKDYQRLRKISRGPVKYKNGRSMGELREGHRDIAISLRKRDGALHKEQNRLQAIHQAVTIDRSQLTREERLELIFGEPERYYGGLDKRELDNWHEIQDGDGTSGMSEEEILFERYENIINGKDYFFKKVGSGQVFHNWDTDQPVESLLGYAHSMIQSLDEEDAEEEMFWNFYGTPDSETDYDPFSEIDYDPFDEAYDLQDDLEQKDRSRINYSNL